ncbi:MAG TPA: 2Fe-2S iron-sulfur cluster-binding protein [Candidatus Babeliaceae bacterium]|nr:2Fe-2S iron-sulfur cluster-binding protein [Candidatus Babeliaceae bacterium]
MEPRLNSIIVHVSYEGHQYQLCTFPNEYRSLMQLIIDKLDIESFGECLGMGKCGTCLIEITRTKHPLSYYERNEDSMLLKTGHQNENIHLACQIMADENIEDLKINILTQ